VRAQADDAAAEAVHLPGGGGFCEVERRVA
jgi:hypothetical protein